MGRSASRSTKMCVVLMCTSFNPCALLMSTTTSCKLKQSERNLAFPSVLIPFQGASFVDPHSSPFERKESDRHLPLLRLWPTRSKSEAPCSHLCFCCCSVIGGFFSSSLSLSFPLSFPLPLFMSHYLSRPWPPVVLLLLISIVARFKGSFTRPQWTICLLRTKCSTI